MSGLHQGSPQYVIAGVKSDDPQSPAYIPSIFSFTSSYLKRKANQDLMRYESLVKRRVQLDEATSSSSDDDDINDSGFSAGHGTNMVSIETQTDLTMADIASLEAEYQCRLGEVASLMGCQLSGMNHVPPHTNIWPQPRGHNPI